MDEVTHTKARNVFTHRKQRDWEAEKQEGREKGEKRKS